MNPSLAIAYATKRAAHKARGGMMMCAHGGPMMCSEGCYAKGGEVNPKLEQSKRHSMADPKMIALKMLEAKMKGMKPEEEDDMFSGGEIQDAAEEEDGWPNYKEDELDFSDPNDMDGYPKLAEGGELEQAEEGEKEEDGQKKLMLRKIMNRTLGRPMGNSGVRVF